MIFLICWCNRKPEYVAVYQIEIGCQALRYPPRKPAWRALAETFPDSKASVIRVNGGPLYFSRVLKSLPGAEMTWARPSQCLLCIFSRSLRQSTSKRRFHVSPIRPNRPGKQHNGKAEIRIRPQELKQYTKQELKALRRKYTPSQIAAIEAGEAAVKPYHLATQAARRKDPWALRYLDDLAKIDPVADSPIRAPYENSDPRQRFMTGDELSKELANVGDNAISGGRVIKESSARRRMRSEDEELKHEEAEVARLEAEVSASSGARDLEGLFDDTAVKGVRFTESADNPSSPETGEGSRFLNPRPWMGDVRITVGKEEAERNPRSALAPELFRPGEPNLEPAPKKKKKATDGTQPVEEPSPALVRLMQMTGYNRQQIQQLRVKTVVQHNITNQTRMGKVNKIYMLSIAGNGNGLIGVGEGKSEEIGDAALQAQYRAIRNMRPILRYEGRTIFGDVKGKVGAVELELSARPPGGLDISPEAKQRANLSITGFGLRCQQYVWEIARCAGISDLAARVYRSRNPMNTVKATIEALIKQKDPEDVARARGRKMVDVRKVYYSGLVT